MITKTITLTSLFLFTLGLAACGGGSNESAKPNDPSSSAATGESTNGAAPEGKCGTTTTTSATDLDACKAECEKLDEKAPEGTRCLPPRTACKMSCDHQYKK